jgi:hypothetical protein
VYEYTLSQAQEDGYLAACEIVKRKPSIDSVTFTKEEILKAGARNIKTGQPLTEADLTKDEYTGKDFDDELFIELRTPKMCADLFELLCENGGPEQKVIIFCTREIHADRVAQHMNNQYVRWCNERRQTPKDHYAFKCMGGPNNGADMIEPMRGSGERAFIACTVDLLEAGVDIERLNAVVFFRYLQSTIKFYQMVGRGTNKHLNTSPPHRARCSITRCAFLLAPLPMWTMMTPPVLLAPTTWCCAASLATWTAVGSTTGCARRSARAASYRSPGARSANACCSIGWQRARSLCQASPTSSALLRR